jgi:hypothetical protein
MNRQISTELARLWVHARSEYEDIRLLEQKLEKARRRHVELHEEIHKLIESAAGPPSGADARPAQNISESGRGFSLHAFTPKGAAGMAHIERVLGTLEVVDDTCVHALKYCEQCNHGLGPEWSLPHGGGGSL